MFEAGALDVWRTTLHMKKGRQGVCLSLLCAPSSAEVLKCVLFTETTAIGCRGFEVEKTALQREQVQFEFEGTGLELKRVYLNGKPLRYKVEYETLANLSQKLNEPIIRLQKRVYAYLEEQERWKFI